MPCYHPLKGFITGINEKTGKDKITVKSYETQYLYTTFEDDYLHSSKVSLCANALNCGEKLCTYKCSDFDMLYLPNVCDVFYEHYTLPCGQCIGCRIDYSKQWATRMLLENEYSSQSYFVTLTYDDEHVPVHEYLCEEDGEFKKSLSLCKRDLQLFNKRLRRHYGAGVRFYACGEYGGSTFRPHYHSIYFNLPISDLQFFKRSPDGKFNYYVSPKVAELWGKGHVLITDVCFETCAYVARYVTKKQKGVNRTDYDLFNIEPVFSLMSRKPGIGRQWFDDNWKKVYDTYIITVSSLKGGLKLKPPRYYDLIFDGLDGARMAEIKEMQQTKAENLIRLKLRNTDKNLLELLADEEENFKSSPRTSHLLVRKEL